MKGGFIISLQARLALTHALFISLALGALTVVINMFTGIVFTTLVKENIARKSGEIVRVIEEQYSPMSRSFDTVTVEAMGMYFVHDGYIVTVEDEAGNSVWAARSCDMQQCVEVVNSIARRMEERFHLGGSIQTQSYPVKYANAIVGNVIIETYGPFFYSETETAFLTSINRLLLAATAVLTLISIVVSFALSRAIARPVLKAGEAARRIAKNYSSGMNRGQTGHIRIDDRYNTKELAELSRSINVLAGELEEAERRQKQLTSDIAHELRTPLTCLQGSIEAMIDGVYAPDREHLESCHEEIIRLANLVQDLYTLTGFEWETLALNKTCFDLAKLLHITVEQFIPAAREKGIKLDLQLCASPVNADYDRLKQVFINILSNAVKYTDSGSIKVGIVPVNSGHWEISIADTGIGIPEGDISRVFERFYRSDKSRSRSTGGTGIGLAIAAAIVHAHGGTISAESSGRGSVFRVRV
ncbi:MAG: ATP-binding protein [Treponema sp.]|jgi:signal transduction histidine kinase|nr:ATP-binding protein [Treponema sp.]